MKEHIIENKNIIIWQENDILFAIFKKNSIIDLKAAEEIVKLRESISLGRVMPLLSDTRNVGNGTKEARAYLASEIACKEISMVAIIVGSNYSRILVSLFMQINKPKNLTKVFTDTTTAEKWLRENLNEVHHKSLSSTSNSF